MKLFRLYGLAALLMGGYFQFCSAGTLEVGPGKQFATIQACANVAQAGDTCLVSAGNYAENVITKFGGTSSNPSQCQPLSGTYPDFTDNTANCQAQRITFKAQGKVVITSFAVRHPFITVDGFELTGVPNTYGYIILFKGADYCQVKNNIIRDGSTQVMGIYFYNKEVNYCLISSNTMKNLAYVFMLTSGGFHLVENNTWEKLNSRDYIYLFGHDIFFRRNVFRNGNVVANVGNHPDWIQSFGDNGDNISYNMVFEKNWIQDLQCAMGQLNSGGLSKGLLTTIHDYTLRRNVLYNIQGNLSDGVPGMVFKNNTFYRTWYGQSGIFLGGSLARGDSARNLLKNNVFIGGGLDSGINGNGGYYSFIGMTYTPEVIRYNVTHEADGLSDPIADGILLDLISNKYLANSNGGLTDKGRAVSTIENFVLGAQYSAYKSSVFNSFLKTAQMDIVARNTFSADHNYVSGAAELGYPAKLSDKCDPNNKFVPDMFCEDHGINGGNPYLKNVNDPLGPDLLPFTADDGFIPLTISPLCLAGENNTDMGAYNCQGCSDNKPIAYIIMDKADGYDPLTIRFDATKSQSCSSSINSYAWDFGDGQTATGATANHTFGDGTFSIKLTVTNDQNEHTTTEKTITVKPAVVPNMVLYLNMDNQITDLSGHEHITKWISATPTYLDGVLGKAMSAASTTSPYVEVNHKDDLDGLAGITIGLWARKGIANQTGAVLTKFITYKLTLTNNGAIATFWTPQNSYTITLGSGTNDTSWHHYAITFDGHIAKIYLDGIAKATTNVTGLINHNADRNIQIGKDPFGGTFVGDIDEVKIFDRAFDNQEIKNLYLEANPKIPQVNAGADQDLGFQLSTSLNGSATDPDGLPNPPGKLTLVWNKISGPGTVTFSDASLAYTTATFSATGKYVLELSAYDGENTGRDNVTIFIGVQNLTPVVSAGSDLSITLPSKAAFFGTAHDDGLPLSPGKTIVTWNLISGPTGSTIETPASLQTDVRFTQSGTYVFELSAFDGALTSKDQIQVEVNANLNQTGSETTGFNSFINIINEKNKGPLHILYSISQPGPATLRIFDRTGQEIVALSNSDSDPAHNPHDFAWDTSNVHSGVYTLILNTADGKFKKKVVVVK